ncbi:MAG TPA: hypothetical protein VKZ54_13620 [Membranihabitans sp.]|nr:hypothetical protein [Membranihabitans sp.]
MMVCGLQYDGPNRDSEGTPCAPIWDGPGDPRMFIAKTNANTYNIDGRTEGVWNLGNNKLYARTDLKMEGADGI